MYPFWLPMGGYATDQDQAAAPPPQPGPDPQLADQLDYLTAQVESLRADQARRDSEGVPLAPPPIAPLEKPPSTVLVYRDGHKIEVQNYAIVGKTLWVFSELRTRQIPLADLDLTATQHVNEDHGVDFTAPSPK